MLGHGVMGRRRSALVAAHPGLTLAVVCDVLPRNLDGLTVDTCADWLEALDRPLDAVMVCLPNHLNAPVTAAALARGLHVLCEKPPARSVAELERVQETPGLTLAYGFNHRRHGSVKHALALVRSGALGTVLHLRGVYGKSAVCEIPGNWRGDPSMAGGGILMDQGIHMVDLMRCFAGEFTSVQALTRGPAGHEEDAMALLRSQGGAVATLHSSATHWRHHFHLHVGLSDGALELDGILSGSRSYAPEILRVWGRDPATGRALEAQETRYDADPSWSEEVDAFARAAAVGAPIDGGGLADARATLALVEQIVCAAERSR